MKPVIIIAIVFVLLIPIPVFAQDVYIKIDELPEWAGHASNVMYLSTEAWAEVNEGLKFWVVEDAVDSDFMVKWVREFGGEYVGYAYGTQFIEVGLGDSNCLNQWNPYSERYISHIMKHEIGHVFGQEHDNNPDSIMYPVALNKEYGLIEEEYRLSDGYGQFIPFSTSCPSKSPATANLSPVWWSPFPMGSHMSNVTKRGSLSRSLRHAGSSVMEDSNTRGWRQNTRKFSTEMERAAIRKKCPPCQRFWKTVNATAAYLGSPNPTSNTLKR